MPRVASSTRTTDGPRWCGSPLAQAHSGPAAPRWRRPPGGTDARPARAAPWPPTSRAPPGRRRRSRRRRVPAPAHRRGVRRRRAARGRRHRPAGLRPARCSASYRGRARADRDRRRASRAGAGRRGSGAPARPAATRPCARARASRRWTHAASASRSTRSPAPFRCIRRPCRRASRTEATATTGPRAAKIRESAEPVIAQSTTAPPAGAIAAIHGKPGVGGSGGCGGRVSGTPIGSAKSATSRCDVGLVSFHPGIRSSGPTPTRRIDGSRSSRRPPGRLCRASGATPADGRRRLDDAALEWRGPVRRR